jgi:drug/metabolite transporter (DMT)-like permease
VSPTRRVWFALGLVYLIWGSIYLAIRYSVDTLPAFVSSGARFVIAGLALAAILLVRKQSLRVSMAEFLGSALVGVLLLGGGIGLVVLAETDRFGLATGIAALLVASVPLMVVLLRMAAGERPPQATVAGTLVGAAGLVVLAWPSKSGGVAVGGAILVVIGAAGWAVGSFLSGRVRLPRDPFVSSVYQMLVGGVLMYAAGSLLGERLDITAVSARSWWAFAYLTAIGSVVAYTAYVWLLHHAPISLVATYAYVNPAVAVVLGAVVLSEPLTPRVLLGGAIILGGVVAVVSTERIR